ncbi:MAG: GGDEF domain-containing protein [Oscillospiraceae bacterium]|nr:GGDEF domain-containing protein [Oscillospiraceae bacterium]
MNKKTIERVEDAIATYKQNPKKAIKALKKLVKEGQETGDVVLIGAAYRGIAYICIQTGDHDAVLSNALKAVALLKDTDEYRLLANAYNVLGYAYSDKESFQMALANYDKAYRILQKHRIYDNNRLYVLNNIAYSYTLMGDIESAIRFLEESLAFAHEKFPDNVSDLLMISVNLAEKYVRLEEYETAREILQSAAKWAEAADFRPLACDYHLRCAIVEYKTGNRAEGDRYTDRALAVIDDTMDAYPLYEDIREVSHILIENGDRERVKRIFDLMTGYAERNADTMEQLCACRMMADYYRSIGDAEHAMDVYERLDVLYDKRLSELKAVQLNVHRKIQEADMEIGKLNREIRESEAIASREPLTGLLNRTALLRVSSEFIEIAAKKKERVGAVFLDIDFFKEYNDTYGHTKGDEIIREIARVCRKEDRANIRFARYGGDEFFGIAHGLKDGELAEIAKRIAARIRNADIPHEKNPNGHRVSLSVGMANVPVTERTNTIIDIANYADKAVYHAKNTGKSAIYMLDHSRGGAEESNAAFIRIDF